MVEGTHEQLLVIDHDGFLTVRISHPMMGVWLQINKPVTFCRLTVCGLKWLTLPKVLPYVWL